MTSKQKLSSFQKSAELQQSQGWANWIKTNQNKTKNKATDTKHTQGWETYITKH